MRRTLLASFSLFLLLGPSFGFASQALPGPDFNPWTEQEQNAVAAAIMLPDSPSAGLPEEVTAAGSKGGQSISSGTGRAASQGTGAAQQATAPSDEASGTESESTGEPSIHSFDPTGASGASGESVTGDDGTPSDGGPARDDPRTRAAAARAAAVDARVDAKLPR